MVPYLLLVVFICASSVEGTAFGHQFKLENFYIDPSLVPLNHGAFGAVPKAIVQKQFGYVELMETSCDEFFHAKNGQILSRNMLNVARASVAAYVGANASNLVFVDNASSAVNAALRSLKLSSNDTILIHQWEYPLGVTVTHFVADWYGANVITVPMAFPTNASAIIAATEEALKTYRPTVFFFDHIASYPALILPGQELINLGKKYGAIVIVDGAHAIGQIPLNLEQLDPDVYLSNGYKWLCSPKNSAIMWVSPRFQSRITPAVLNSEGPLFQDKFFWTGTRDFSAWLSMKDTIEFRQSFGEENWTSYNNNLCTNVFNFLQNRWGIERAIPASMTASLLTFPIPCQNNRCKNLNSYTLQSFLQLKYNVLSVILSYNGNLFARLSCQVYNEMKDYEVFAQGVEAFFASQGLKL